MTALYMLAALGNLVCFIIVLIQLFKAKGALHGILGLICGIYTFIWGWMVAKQLNIQKIMLIWSACFGLQLVTGVFAGAAMSKDIMKQVQEAQQNQAK